MVQVVEGVLHLLEIIKGILVVVEVKVVVEEEGEQAQTRKILGLLERESI
jgi:hypothetical protein